MSPLPAVTGWSPGYLRLWQVLLLASIPTIGACFDYSPVHSQDWQGVSVFIALSIAASVMPVRLPGNFITISPSLPVIFAAAGLFGASAAVLAAIIGTASMGFMSLQRHKTYRARKMLQLVSAAAITNGSPALLYVLLQTLFFPHHGIRTDNSPSMEAWVALSFCTLLAFVSSYLLTTFLSSRYYGRRWDVIWHDTARWNMISGPLMSPVAFVAGVLYREHWWLGVAFIIVPTWALHMGVVYHEKKIAAYKLGVELLGRIMQESHPYTHGHLNRVAHWAKKIAEEMHLPAESMQFIEDAAILHDIGKVAVDDRVLNKVGSLTDEDWNMIRKHPVVGSDIVGQIRYFNRVSHWIRHHHERPDGAGYPDSMALDAIPVEACIISVVDAYDAMVGGPAKADKRPYREPMLPEAAVAELRRHAGTQFHSEVVETFTRILERERVIEENGEVANGESAVGGDSLWDAPLNTPAAQGISVAIGGKA